SIEFCNSLKACPERSRRTGLIESIPREPSYIARKKNLPRLEKTGELEKANAHKEPGSEP
ncbi:MAG: hypothetical protein WA634_10845, partial [Silvibacterium sp.]